MSSRAMLAPRLRTACLLALPAALLAPPLAATPAVLFNVFAGAWLFARAQLPVRTALLGEQTVGPVFTAGIRYEAL
jgi:hypothetical protein